MRDPHYGEAEPSPHIERRSRFDARLVAAILLRVLCVSAVMEVDTKTARGAEKAEFAQTLDPL